MSKWIRERSLLEAAGSITWCVCGVQCAVCCAVWNIARATDCRGIFGRLAVLALCPLGTVTGLQGGRPRNRGLILCPVHIVQTWCAVWWLPRGFEFAELCLTSPYAFMALCWINFHCYTLGRAVGGGGYRRHCWTLGYCRSGHVAFQINLTVQTILVLIAVTQKATCKNLYSDSVRLDWRTGEETGVQQTEVLGLGCDVWCWMLCVSTGIVMFEYWQFLL